MLLCCSFAIWGFYIFSYKVFLKEILYEKKVNFESILFSLISSF